MNIQVHYSRRTLLMVALCVGAIAITVDASAARRALLIGCTTYPHLDEALHLRGPGNDVELMRRLLSERFDVAGDDIVVLAEATGQEQLRPTRVNIAREFRRLAGIAQQGDFIVVYFSGHGTQQPDDDPDNQEDIEPDGMDEVLCPADVMRITSEGVTAIPGGIADDELRQWLGRITETGATVWVIVDACHSGTVIRGGGGEVVRRILPERLIPGAATQRASAAARQIAIRGSAGTDGLDVEQNRGELVAIYAAQSGEPAVEKTLPKRGSDRKRHGLLTYTLASVLTQTDRPLTYEELVDRIRLQYAQWGRTYPTPLAEGNGKDREVLGVKRFPRRPPISLTRLDDSSMQVSAGSLHGLTDGSILAVSASAGAGEAVSVVGHVRIVDAGSVTCRVTSCRHDTMEAVDNLPDGGRCRVVFVDYGVSRLRVAVKADSASHDTERSEVVRRVLENLSGKPGAPAELVTDPARADYLVWTGPDDVCLSPAEGITDTTATFDFVHDAHSDGDLSAWLRQSLGRIAKARNLIALAAGTPKIVEPAEDLFAVRVEVRLVKYFDRLDRQGHLVTASDVVELQSGDVVGFEIANRSKFPTDVTLLFVDSGYGIHPFFPAAGTVTDNRVPAGRVVRTGTVTINADTTGREHVVALAVPADGAPVDFGWLTQPSIRQASRVRGGLRGADTPLGRLLQTSLFAHGNTRGMHTDATRHYHAKLISWRTVARQRADEVRQNNSGRTSNRPGNAGSE